MKKKDNNIEEKGDIVNIISQIRSFLISFLVVIVLVFLINSFVGRIVKVDGHSMDKTLNHGQTLILDSITYKFSDPKRFDIVVFPHDDKFFIKRIIALPNETVQIIDGYVYVNGQKLEGDKFSEEIIDRQMYGIAGEKIVLGSDEYFCLGDNRNHSKDSRSQDVGLIHKSEFTGRVIYRLLPFKTRGFLGAK